MLLQAAGNVAYLTRTCFTENFHQEGEASRKRSKKHKQGRGTHCYLSSNAHFAHQYGNHFTCLCKTHTRRYALCHRMGANRIPAGLHEARKHSLRKTVAVTAAKNPPNQDTSQQGEASKQGSSMVYKTAMLSAKGVKVEGLQEKAVIINGNANLDSAHLSNTDTASSEKADSEAFVSRKPTKQLAGGIKDLTNWWKTLHEVYREDSAMWGYGSSPIFTVYEGPDSKIEKVVIDEKEIQRRQGVEPLLAGFGDDESRARAEQKIVHAQSIAKDLEMGKIDLDSRSTIFTVVKHPSRAENRTGRQKLLSQIDFAVHKAAPVLKSVFMIAIPLYGICILFGAYLLVTKRSEEDLIKEEKSAVSLEKMRKLKAQMNSHKESAGVGQATLAPSDFMQKLLEVREMARKVRSEEGLQNSVKDSDTDVEEYQPQEQSAPNQLENVVGIEQGGIGHEDVIDTTIIESSVPTMDNMGAIKSNNNVIDVRVKPPPKVKPRIITSLDEAMAVIGSEPTVVPNGTQSSPDLNGTGKKAIFERETQAEHESAGIASKAHYDNLTATSNGVNNSQSSVAETMSSKVVQIPTTSLGVQDSAAETQSIQSNEIEVPQSGVHDKTDTGTLDRLASEGQSKEAQTFESKLKRGSDDFQDSDKTVSSHLLSENLEIGPVTEIQIPSSARSSEANNLAQKPFKKTFDGISGEVLPSARSKTFLKKYSASKSLLNTDTDEVVGSGQPLRRRESGTTSSGPMSNTKRWSKELQRKYDLERDPEARELMKEIGSELDSWITEEEVEDAGRLASKLEEVDDDVIHKHYEKVHKKIKQEKEKFGMEAVLEKYKEYQPNLEDELWWLDLRCVLCLMVVSAKQGGEGLYGLDMSIDSEGISNQVARHVIAFEDRKDASNFCRLLELRSGSRFQFAEVCPFSSKKLFEVSKEEGFKVTVLRTNQIQTNVDQTLEEVEEQIVEIGRSVYWEKMDRDRSIDIDSILHQRFGL